MFIKTGVMERKLIDSTGHIVIREVPEEETIAQPSGHGMVVLPLSYGNKFNISKKSQYEKSYHLSADDSGSSTILRM